MALVGLFLVVTPMLPELRLPALVMIFPLWIIIATASYLLPKTHTAAWLLIGVSVGAFGLIHIMKSAGVTSI